MKKIFLYIAILIFSFKTTQNISNTAYNPIGSQVIINDIALQSTGTIIGVGNVTINGVNEGFVVRYNTDGSIDTTFGTNGYIYILAGTATFANAVAIDASNNIIVTGYAIESGIQEIMLTRYTSAGAVDTTFNGGNIATTSVTGSNYSAAMDVKIQSSANGSDIVIVGYANFNTGNQIFVASYTTAGILDTTFNSAGVQPGVITTSIPNQASANSLVLQPSNGYIIAVGASFYNGSVQAVAARYTTTGTLDSTYGTNGIATLSSPTFATCSAIQSSNDYLVLGGTYNNSDFVLARLTTSGALDATFGIGGIVTTSIEAPNLTNILIQPNGDIVAIGSIGNFAAIGRYTSSGAFDTTFGTNGITTIEVGSQAIFTGVALQSNNNLIASGYSDTNALTVGFTSTGIRNVNFATDGISTFPRGNPISASTFADVIFGPLSFSQNTTTVPTNIGTFYSATASLYGWGLPISTTAQTPVTLTFNVPSDFDTNWAPSANLTFFVKDNSVGSTDVANIQLQADFEANNNALLGASFTQALTSGNVTIIEPTSGNLQTLGVSYLFNGSTINAGDIGVIVIDRVAPTTGTEYPDAIYLASLIFRYKKVVH